MANIFPLVSTGRFFSWEAREQIEKYLDGYENFWDFADTFAFNFGLMYDSVITSI